MLRFNRWVGIAGFVATSACAGTDAETPGEDGLSLGVEQAAVVSVPLTSVYQGAQLSDAFSSVVSLGNGIVLAGKRSWNSFAPNRAIYRSVDYGRNWAPVANPAGITGSHVYFFGHHVGTGKLYVGTGDTGNVCLMITMDSGATWSVALTTAQIRALAGTSSNTAVKAVFSPVHFGNGRWLVSLRNDETNVYMLETLDHGATWHAFRPPGIDTSARKMIKTSDGTLLYAGFVQQNGMYVSHDSGQSFTKTASFQAFSGMADLGGGVYLAGTYATGSFPVSLSLYKSTNFGNSWSLKKTVSVPTGLGYFRSITEIKDNLVVAYASCDETSWTDRCAETYVSKDVGEHWTDEGQTFIGPFGNMNAIYDSVVVKPGTIVAVAQPDSNILRASGL